MSDPVWLSEARKYIGTKEIPGPGNNPIILRWWMAIKTAFNQDSVPWCAAFTGGCLEAVGIRSSRSAMARSYSRWGLGVAPAVGAIVVFSRPPSPTSGHVGFVVGRDQHGRLMVLGGNQSDAVNIRAFTLDRVLGYRWPDDHPSRLPGPGTVNRLPIVRSDGTVSTNEA